MLDEAVEYLDEAYGAIMQNSRSYATSNGKPDSSSIMNGSTSREAHHGTPAGWEILIISDGSTDRTIDVALRFARAHQLGISSSKQPDTQSSRRKTPQDVPGRSLRVVSLQSNRGKGGAVTHGLRHARGKYVLFADADGASTFSDLGKLMTACKEIQDVQGRAVAIGSRAHLVGSEAVVKVRSDRLTEICLPTTKQELANHFSPALLPS